RRPSCGTATSAANATCSRAGSTPCRARRRSRKSASAIGPTVSSSAPSTAISASSSACSRKSRATTAARCWRAAISHRRRARSTPCSPTPPAVSTDDRARRQPERVRGERARFIFRRWNSTMIVRFLAQQDESNPLNGLIMADNEHLPRILASLRTRKPFWAQLFGDNGYNLMVGIGGTSGCVQYSRSDGNSPYLVAVAANPTAEEGDIEFLCGNTPTPVSKRYILPF